MATLPNKNHLRGANRTPRQQAATWKRVEQAVRQRPGGDAASEFASLLVSTRLRYKFSQLRLAGAAGCDCSHLSRLERDERSPTRGLVLDLTAAMGCSAVERDRLLVAAGYMPVERANLFADIPDLARLIRVLDDHEIPERVRTRLERDLELCADDGAEPHRVLDLEAVL